MSKKILFFKGKHVSTLKEIKHGGPQGSSLELVLILFYINGLPMNIKEMKIILFADDTDILMDRSCRKE
jgi:hypothetical protein